MKVENAVKVEPVGEFELKGIRRPLAAYNVLAIINEGARKCCGKRGAGLQSACRANGYNWQGSCSETIADKALETAA